MTLLDRQELQRTIACWSRVLGEPVQALRPDALADEQRRGAIVWDVRSAASHHEGHPEGARSLGGVDWLLADAFGGNLVPRPVIANRLADIDIAPGRRVIVYATPGGVDVLIALRALRAIGVRDLAVCDATSTATATSANSASSMTSTTSAPTATAPALIKATAAA